MINHIPTLLLNEPASLVSAWPVDQDFMPLSLSGLLKTVHDLLVPPEMTISDKESRVVQLMPFALSPEFSDILGTMDRRETFSVSTPKSVAEFYGLSMRGEWPDVTTLLSSDQVARFFMTFDSSETGISSYLSRLNQVYAQSAETTRRLSSVVIAYLLKANNLWIKSR